MIAKIIFVLALLGGLGFLVGMFFWEQDIDYTEHLERSCGVYSMTFEDRADGTYCVTKDKVPRKIEYVCLNKFDKDYCHIRFLPPE